MIRGYSLFGQSKFYKTQVSQNSYDYLEGREAIYDEIFVTKDPAYDIKNDRSYIWDLDTVMNANFNGHLEGGNLQAMENMIDTIEFSKRVYGSTEWTPIGRLPFNSGKVKNYNMLDIVVNNGFEYEYSVTPVISDVRGNRIKSKPIKVYFEDLFLSDDTANYRFIYNVEESSIEHNISSSTHRLLNHRFPLVVQGSNDYKTGSIKLLYIHNNLENNPKLDIKDEYLSRNNLLNFLKNKKPKLLKFSNGESLIIRINDNVSEERLNSIEPISDINFNFTEVMEINEENIKKINLFKEIKEVDSYV